MSFEVAHRTSVPADRLPGWVERFTARHGQLVVQYLPDALLLCAADGALARLINLWEPLPADMADLATAIQHLTAPRTFGLLLVRKGADAVGIAEGDQLVAHRISRHYVQARTKAGGWSQQRYARRRDNQADEIVEAAAEHVDRILGPRTDLAFLVTGGDRPLLNAALKAIDHRLADLPLGAHLGVGTPDARMLAVVPDRVLAVQVRIGGPQPDPDRGPLDPSTG